MKIILNGAAFDNKGAEAMAHTVHVELAKRLPGIEIFSWKIMEESFARAIESGMKLLYLPIDLNNSKLHMLGRGVGSRLWSAWEMFRATGFIKHFPDLMNSEKLFCRAAEYYIRRKLHEVDAFVDSGGYAYGDTWGLSGFRRIEAPVNLCAGYRKPIVFLPQAWGPFEKKPVRDALRRLMSNQNTLFYSRDESSSRYLEEALEKPMGSIPSYPDIVFRFSEADPQQGERILRDMGCAMKRPIIGISPNMRIYERAEGKDAENSYLRTLARLTKYILENYDADVVVQANEIVESRSRKDDRFLCGLIASSVDRPDRCFTTQDYLSAEASKSLIGRFDYLIGSRFHSFVFALSQGIPGMAIAWAHKYRELFSIFGLEDEVHEFKELNMEALLDTFNRGWNQREQTKLKILPKVKDLQVRIDALFDELADRIKNEH
jgi:polysaccharide pyruvyl transferase WcaK-like protein